MDAERVAYPAEAAGAAEDKRGAGAGAPADAPAPAFQGGFALHHSAGAARPAQKPGRRDVARECSWEPCATRDGAALPAWIKGTLYRQSGGAFVEGAEGVELDGLAHITAFHFAGDGQVSFSNRYMRTKDFRTFVASGKRTWGGTAVKVDESPGVLARAVGLVSKLWAKPPAAPPALYKSFNPNVTTWLLSSPDDKGIRLAAATEADGTVCEFDPTSLDTVQAVETLTLAKDKGMVITNAAHWFMSNEASGGYHVGLELSWKISIKGPIFSFRNVLWHGMSPPYRRVAERPVAKFGWSERTKQPIENRPSYMHTVAQTTNHVITINSNKRVLFDRLLENKFDQGFFGLFRDENVLIDFEVYRISNKATGDLEYVGNFKCENGSPCTLWHLANCFESDDRRKLVIDGSVSIVPLDRKWHEVKTEDHELQRFTIDLDSGKATSEVLLGRTSTEGFEFPGINPRFHMQRNEFIFALGNPLAESNCSVVKLNTATGESVRLAGLRANESPMEPLFVPRPGAAEGDELDGVLLVEAIDMDTGSSDLLFVEPREFTVTARVPAPVGANFGLHSTWIDPELLPSQISKF